jgi:putative dimethyl sulfoxide reductase chaperone
VSGSNVLNNWILKIIGFANMDIKNQDHNILKGYNLLLYFAGSMIMYEPNEECIVDFWQQGIIMKLPVSSSNPNFAKAASQLRDSCIDKSLCLNMLREDYNRLFDGKDIPLAPPFESLYSHDSEPVQTAARVTDFYDSYGWISKFKGKIKDDHLGIELLFLTLLVEKYLVLDDQVCIVEMRNEIRRFIDEHIFSWIRHWNTKMQEFSTTLCYKGIATLIYACIEDIYSLCDNTSSTFIQPGYLKN